MLLLRVYAIEVQADLRPNVQQSISIAIALRNIYLLRCLSPFVFHQLIASSTCITLIFY